MAAPPDNSLKNAVEAFVNTQTWVESRDVLRSQQALLFGADAARLLDELIEDYRDTEATARRLALLRDIVTRARMTGIDAAYADLITPQYQQKLYRELDSLPWSHRRRLAVLHALLALTEPDQPAARLALQQQIAEALIHSREGDHDDNVERAIALLLEAENNTSPDATPHEWSSMEAALSIAYRHRRRGDRADNLEQALMRARKAASIADVPANDRTVALNALANAYAERLAGTREENLKEAVACLHEALNLAPENQPQWAMTQNNLGLLHEQQNDFAEAVRCYQAALTVFSPDKFPDEWNGLQARLLRAAYRDALMPAPDDEAALTRYEAAMDLMAPLDGPREKADLALRAMDLYGRRQSGAPIENVSAAIRHGAAALAHLTTYGGDESLIVQLRLRLSHLHEERARRVRATDPETAWADAVRALEILPDEAGAEQRARAHHNAGEYFRSRKAGDGADNIERAIAHFRAALDAFTPETFPRDCGLAENSLGGAYLERQEGDASENIEEAIGHLGAALALRPREKFESYWAKTKHNLGIAFMRRIRGDPVGNVETAIGHLEDARQVPVVIPGQQAMLARLHKLLADMLYDRQRGDRTATLDDVVMHYRRALALRDGEGQTDAVSDICSGLAIALLERPAGPFAEDLEEAIALQRRVATIWTRDKNAYGWALAQHNLGNVYGARMIGDPGENLEEAIRCFNAAHEVLTRQAHPEDWAMTHNSLGCAYLQRLHGDQADNIEKAIDHYSLAAEVYTPERFPEDWAMAMFNAGNAYLRRQREGRDANIEVAINCYNASLEFRTRERLPFFWAMTKLNLATAYGERRHGDRGDNVRRAIEHLRDAEDVYTPAEFPRQWARIRAALGDAHAADPRGDRAENLGLATDAYDSALAVITEATDPHLWALLLVNLAPIYAALAAEGDRSKRIQAIEYLNQALRILTPDSDPRHCAYALEHLAEQYALSGDWQAACETYERAIAASETVLAAAFTPAGLQKEAGSIGDLSAGAAYCLLRLGRPEESLVRLDAGKARLLFESLSRNDADLSRLPPDLSGKIEAARSSVRTLETELRARESGIHSTRQSAQTPFPPAPPIDPQTGFGFSGVRRIPLRQAQELLAPLGLKPRLDAMLRRARAELRTLLDDAQQQGYYRPPTVLDGAAIRAEAPAGGALVSLMITPFGSAAWVLPHGSTEIGMEHVVALGDDTHRRLAGIRSDWLSRYLDWQEGGPLGDWQRCIEDVGRQLWDCVVADIRARLVQLNLPDGAPVVTIPHAGIALMPLHVAWRMTQAGPRMLLDDYALSSAPSIYALHVSRNRASEAARRGDNLLAIANPTGDLRFTELEYERVAAQFAAGQCRGLAGADATEDNAVAAIPGHAYVHFACHGRYDWRNVLRSELTLADQTHLSLARIVSPDVDMSAIRLVVLSACETGLTEFQQAPDELLGLPAGFLEAGAPGVVSTLWAVNDLSMAYLMEGFYHRHRVGKEPIAQALRAAQLALRDATARELGLAERWEGVYRASGCNDPAAFKLMRYFRANPDVKPFKSACYWAAAVFTGS